MTQQNTPNSEFEKILKAAQQGSVNAQFRLGGMYYEGFDGVEQDYKLAYEWFVKAANQGNVDAQVFLGTMFYNGTGVEQDYKQAFSWLSKAADRSSPEAQNLLGHMYYEGKGVAQNYRKAVKLLRKVADKFVSAACTLSKIYAEGLGVKKDQNEAMNWLINAGLVNKDNLKINEEDPSCTKSEQIKKQARELKAFLTEIFVNREDNPLLAQRVSEIIDDAAKQAVEGVGLKYEEVFEEDKAPKQDPKPKSLGKKYQATDVSKDKIVDAEEAKHDQDKAGQDVVQDFKDSSTQLLKAAQDGDAEAQFKLGTMYYLGKGVTQDYKQASEWYLKAAKQDHAQALFNLGKMYDKGKGVEQDYLKAKEYYEKAADLDHLTAIRVLGDMYLEGRGIPKDTAKAKRLFKKAITLEKNS